MVQCGLWSCVKLDVDSRKGDRVKGRVPGVRGLQRTLQGRVPLAGRCHRGIEGLTGFLC